LVQAIHDYKGGVIIISHNREFAGAVCQEKWIMDKGRLRREGESVALHEEEEKKEELGDKVVIDALGNEIKVSLLVLWVRRLCDPSHGIFRGRSGPCGLRLQTFASQYPSSRLTHCARYRLTSKRLCPTRKRRRKSSGCKK
jgi:hypothetical protein